MNHYKSVRSVCVLSIFVSPFRKYATLSDRFVRPSVRPSHKLNAGYNYAMFNISANSTADDNIGLISSLGQGYSCQSFAAFRYS